MQGDARIFTVRAFFYPLDNSAKYLLIHFANGDPNETSPREEGREAEKTTQGMALAWAASPSALIRYSLMGIANAAMAPVSVYLGASLVNLISRAHEQSMSFGSILPTIIALGLLAATQRAIGAYGGYGRNLFVRRVQLEAERRLIEKASKIDLGHFDNSDWHDRLARAKRDVSWRPGDLTWSVLGLSGNLVSIILMASLLATLHYVLVILAVLAACACRYCLNAGLHPACTSSFTKRRRKNGSGNTSETCLSSLAILRKSGHTSSQTTCWEGMKKYRRISMRSANGCTVPEHASRR